MRLHNTIIENEAAYHRAIKERMQANSRKSSDKWLQEDPSREQLVNRLYRFEGKEGFLGNMLQSYLDWGKLSPKQEAAVRNSFAKMDERKATARAEQAAKNAGSKHIGTVGERSDFTLTIRKIVELESFYGPLIINIMADQDGNVVVYKGNKALGERDSTISIKATVKAHEERDGVKQTILNRPKLV